MRGVRMVRSLLMAVGLVVLGRLAMMACRVLVVVGRSLMVLDDLVLGHDALRPVLLPTMIGGTHRDFKKAMLQVQEGEVAGA